MKISLPKELKVAIVHYWLDRYRGGERAVEVLCEMFPHADVYTHVYKPKGLPNIITKHKVFTSFISKLPFAKRFYRYYLPLMPFALWLLNLKKYDLIISSESGPAKGIRKRKDALHICYCHSPMRYIWDMQKDYICGSGLGTRVLWPLVACYMRYWDRKSARNVDYFIANSKFVSARIRKFYKRKSAVIHPPVETGKFKAKGNRDAFYLCVSQLVCYKKVELVVEAFNKLGLRLVVIGEGTEFDRIKNIAKQNVKLLGKASEEILKKNMENCKAFVYAGKEDFGIVLVEALSAGAPVIAYGKGGIRDIVKDGETGFFFKDQTSESIVEAVRKFEDGKIKCLSSVEIAKEVDRFSKEKFKKQMFKIIKDKL